MKPVTVSLREGRYPLRDATACDVVSTAFEIYILFKFECWENKYEIS